MGKTKEKIRKRPDPKVRTFFIIAFPSLIVAMMGILAERTIFNAMIITALIIYQFVMLKQAMDQYYDIL